MASLARSLSGRALHIRVIPRPSHLGESREIFRLISQFGHVEHFKSLKYDALSAPNTLSVIFEDAGAATHMLKNAPIKFRMGFAVHANGIADGGDTAATLLADSSASSSPDQLEAEGAPREEPSTPQPRIFQMAIYPSRAHFRDLVASGPYHGRFKIDTDSIPQQDLAQTVPLPGLSCVDWRKKGEPWRLAKRQKLQRRKTLRELYTEAHEALP